jgi:tRNA-specific 2-thiouridylase
MNKNRVVVAMSGGVDSSVAAAWLKNQGYEVIGITLCFNLPDSQSKRPTCCSIQGIEDARRVCHKLGIRHYVLSMQKELEKYVIRNFCQEYLRGRTPNPCIRCNQYIKFDALLRKATALGAKFLATGHYARIEKIQNPQPKGFREAQSKIQKYLIRKAKDLKKDQSYFLYRLNQNQLKYILFPLGDYTKDQVRKLAREFDLPVADKLASQEICFLPDMDYRRFLKARLSYKLKPGLIVDIEGNILGKHQGITFYTIGQREGLGIAKGYPLYITKIDAQRNQITVGKKEDALKKEFLVKDLHFVLRPIKKKIEFKVRIRYNHKEKLAELIPWHNRIKVCFKQTQFAITPGQAAVFYDQDKVMGGGIIDKVINGDEKRKR